MTVMKTENIDTETAEKINLSTVSPQLVEGSSDTTSSQLYESIVNDIQLKSDVKLSKAEANIAARNLVELVKIMINYFQEYKK